MSLAPFGWLPESGPSIQPSQKTQTLKPQPREAIPIICDGNFGWALMSAPAMLVWHSRPRLCLTVMKLKKNRYQYRRNLPHFQKDDRAHFVTFITYKRWVLPARARDIVLDCCLHLNGTKIRLHAVVVMPEHVHLIFSALYRGKVGPYSFAEILNPIKGYSAHQINKLLKRNGKVWLDESMDHVLRSQEKLDAKIEYLRQNPVRKGLVKDPSQYRWLWVDPAFAQPGTAVPHEHG